MNEDDLEFQDIYNGCPILETICVAALGLVVVAIAVAAWCVWG